MWTYEDAAGDPCGLVVRWDAASGKRILPVSRDSARRWANRAMPSPRPLYRLPELLAANPDRVWIVEGEKSADAARSLGIVASTSSGGSNAAAKSDWSSLSGRDVVILPDRDAAGERYAASVARFAMDAKARSVRIVRLCERWSELPEGGDVADIVERLDADTGALQALLVGIESMASEAEVVQSSRREGAPVFVRMSDVTPQPVRWLWPGRVALGKVTLLSGDPGLGKSAVTLDIAARVTRGDCWPDAPDTRTEPGGVILLSAEDDPADTIRPRLDAMGADTTRIIALEATSVDMGQRPVNLSTDIRTIEETIEAMSDCRMVVIDPIAAYLGVTDSHKNADVRAVLAPLSVMAARHGVAVVAVAHLNKATGGRAIHRSNGSMAFVAAARAAWIIAKDPHNDARRLMLPAKNNLAPDSGGLAYRVDGASNGALVVTWESEPVRMSADEALALNTEADAGASKAEDAREWLRDLLAEGPKPAKDIEALAEQDGIAFRTVERVKHSLGVESVRVEGVRCWSLRVEDGERSLDRQDRQDRQPLHTGGVGGVGGVDGGEGLRVVGDDARPHCSATLNGATSATPCAVDQASGENS